MQGKLVGEVMLAGIDAWLRKVCILQSKVVSIANHNKHLYDFRRAMI